MGFVVVVVVNRVAQVVEVEMVLGK